MCILTEFLRMSDLRDMCGIGRKICPIQIVPFFEICNWRHSGCSLRLGIDIACYASGAPGVIGISADVAGSLGTYP